MDLPQPAQGVAFELTRLRGHRGKWTATFKLLYHVRDGKCVEGSMLPCAGQLGEQEPAQPRRVDAVEPCVRCGERLDVVVGYSKAGHDAWIETHRFSLLLANESNNVLLF